MATSKNTTCRDWIRINSTKYPTKSAAFDDYNRDVGEVSRSQFSALWNWHASQSEYKKESETRGKNVRGRGRSLSSKVQKLAQLVATIQADIAKHDRRVAQMLKVLS